MAMTDADIADPERALVLAYAPADRRAALRTLWQLDERLGTIVASTSEPMIGRIRLAWWRESLEALDRRHAPAEPLLAAVQRLILPLGVSGAELAEIEEGWAALIDEPDIALHGSARGGRLFVLAARILGGAAPGIEQAGAGWALADLAHRLSDPAERDAARTAAATHLARLPRWPARLRSLGALAMLARRDAATVARRQGSPARVARVLLHRLTGR